MKVFGKLTWFVFLFVLFTFSAVKGQDSQLTDNFRDYEIVTFDSKSLKEYSEKRSNDFIRIPFMLSEKYNWNLELTTSKLFSDKYVFQNGASKRSKKEANLPIILKGYGQSSNRTRATITVNNDFLYGRVETEDEVIYFEPLSTFDKKASPDQIVIYKESDVIENNSGTCAAISIAKEKERLTFSRPKAESGSSRSAGPCLEVELAIANEFNITQARSNVASWNAGVIANVNTDYDDAGFDNPIQFVIVETYISTGNGSSTNQNEWGSATDAGVLLSNFRSWAPSANGFNNTHDLGELWTNTDITWSGNASVVGLASIGTVCGFARYHVLEDFTNNASQTRTLVSHEIGHNFDMNHDDNRNDVIMSGFISSSGSTTWGDFSLGEINNYLGGGTLGCLGTCDGNPPGGGGGTPPEANFNGSLGPGECVPEFQFIDLSTNSPTSWAWQFENGTPSTSTSQNPLIEFPGSGNYGVTLTVTNDAGSDDLIGNLEITGVWGNPKAAFTSTTNGNTASFNNNTAGSNSYLWGFGDGENSTLANPDHTYAGAGLYSVTLTATNACGSDDFISNITIVDDVNASFQVDQRDGCIGEIFEFSSTSTGNITSYFWEFEGGSPSTSTSVNPSVTFTSEGFKNVSLTVSNGSSNDVRTLNNYIEISNAPNVDFEFNVSDFTVAFANNTQGGNSYSWNFGDGGTSAIFNANHTYAGPGDYAVTLSSTNSCGTNEITKVVSLESDLVAEFSASSAVVCEGETVQYTSSSMGAISSYFWQFEGGTPSTSTAENPLVSYATVGNYNVVLTVSDGTLQDSETKNNLITTTEAPEVDFTFETDQYQVEFSNSSRNADSFSWNFGDGETSTAANSSHTYASPGTYDVILEATNACGTTSTSQSVNITEILVADFTLSDNEICVDNTIAFTSTSEGDIVSYFWEFEGANQATATTVNPSVNYEVAGVFTVKLTVTSAFGGVDSKTLTNIITVKKDPEADFTYTIDENTVSFVNQSEGFDNVTWDFGDQTTSNSVNPTHTYSEEGNYIVSLQVGNDCATVGTQITIAVFDDLLANFQASSTSICPGEEVVLEDLSKGDPTEWEWAIRGNQVISAVVQNPVIDFELAGTYAVELTVRNAEKEDTKLRQQYIEVKPLPKADFSLTQDQLMVSFSNSSENGLTYLWDFGDGNTSRIANPTHTYAAEGDYDITLEVENSCSVLESTQGITVQAQLVAAFTAESREICETNSIQFSNQSSASADSWEWEFPGGIPATSTAQNPLVTYPNSGEYDVILKVTRDGEELQETKNSFVSVGKLPAADFSFEIDRDEVQFFNLSENGDSYKWSFGSEVLNPSFVFNEEAAYEVTLITTNGCTSDTTSRIVDLFAAADTYANFSNSENSYCKGDEISFIDLSSEDITEWKWNFPGAIPAESNEKNPQIMYEAFGSYDVELTVSNGFNTRTLMLADYVTIIESPEAGFTIEQTDNYINVIDQAKNAQETEWSVGKEKIEGTFDSYTFQNNGNFKIRQVARNSCGESEYADTVLVSVFPSASFSLDVSQGCAPLSVNFESRSADNVEQVTWLLEGLENPVVEGFSPTVTYEEPGNYGISVIATNSFGSDTIELSSLIEVLNNPAADFTYTLDGISADFSVENGVYDSVKWNLGDGAFSSELAFTHAYAEEDLYLVELEVFTGECSNIIVKEIDFLSSSLDDIESLPAITLYPNPASDFLNVDFNGIVNVASIDVIDQLGRRLMSTPVSSGSEFVKIQDLGSIPAGQYYISINIKDKPSIYSKIVLVR